MSFQDTPVNPVNPDSVRYLHEFYLDSVSVRGDVAACRAEVMFQWRPRRGVDGESHVQSVHVSLEAVVSFWLDRRQVTDVGLLTPAWRLSEFDELLRGWCFWAACLDAIHSGRTIHFGREPTSSESDSIFQRPNVTLEASFLKEGELGLRIELHLHDNETDEKSKLTRVITEADLLRLHAEGVLRWMHDQGVPQKMLVRAPREAVKGLQALHLRLRPRLARRGPVLDIFSTSLFRVDVEVAATKLVAVGDQVWFEWQYRRGGMSRLRIPPEDLPEIQASDARVYLHAAHGVPHTALRSGKHLKAVNDGYSDLFRYADGQLRLQDLEQDLEQERRSRPMPDPHTLRARSPKESPDDASTTLARSLLERLGQALQERDFALHAARHLDAALQTVVDALRPGAEPDYYALRDLHREVRKVLSKERDEEAPGLASLQGEVVRLRPVAPPKRGDLLVAEVAHDFKGESFLSHMMEWLCRVYRCRGIIIRGDAELKALNGDNLQAYAQVVSEAAAVAAAGGAAKMPRPQPVRTSQPMPFDDSPLELTMDERRALTRTPIIGYIPQSDENDPDVVCDDATEE